MSERDIICAVCGVRNEPGARFCQECGSELAANSAGPTPAPTPTVDQPVAPPASGPGGEPDASGETASAGNPTAIATDGEPATTPPIPPAAPPPERPRWAPPPPVSPPLPSISGSRGTGPASGAAGSARADRQRGDGNWFTSAPPQSIVLVGLVMVLGSCLLISAGQVDPTGTLVMLSICAGPIGLVIFLVGLVRLLRRRAERRF